ncbi:unnamed protein product [Schistosoma turkestanicum]|nr:unnamed protein product [Schistosoma turkestanicum]
MLLFKLLTAFKLYHRRIQPIVSGSILSWRRSQSHYKTKLSTHDLVEVINQKAKIHKYIKPQEPGESLYTNNLEKCESEQKINIISEDDQLDFGALSADNLDRQPYHESLIPRSMDVVEKKSVIDELVSTDEFEEDPADCLRLSKIYRRHPPEHYSDLIRRYCATGDTNSALSVFFSDMLEKDRVLPSRFHVHVLMNGLAMVGDSENAFRVYRKMIELGISATQATYSYLLRACAEDIATWFRNNKINIPPILHHIGNDLSLVQRKKLALQKVLTLDMLPEEFGGPAVHRVHSFWRRITEKNILLNQFTYNALISALAKAGDIHGCLRALDMMMTTENCEYSTGKSSKYKNKWLIPNTFTLSFILSAIVPATMKRNLHWCRQLMISGADDNTSSKQLTNTNDTAYHHLSPFQLALSLWHELIPLIGGSVAPHHFTLLAKIMALPNDCFDTHSNCEMVFVNNTRCKSFQDILKSVNSTKSMNLLIHPSCTSSEIASMMIAQAQQQSLVSLNNNNNTSVMELNSTNNELVAQKKAVEYQLDWNDTMLALRSPINVLLPPTDKPIVICGPKNQNFYPWQRLALVGGLHGLLDFIANYYQLKIDIQFFNAIISVLPYPIQKSIDSSMENVYDLWEMEIFNLLAKCKLTPDIGLYNALIHRRTSNGVNANYLLADMTRKGIIPDQITWGCLARGCHTKESVKQLLHGYEIAATTPSLPSTDSGSLLLHEQKIYKPIFRPSFTFFSTLLSTSGFDWELKAFVINYMMYSNHVDELTSGKKSFMSKRHVSSSSSSSTSSSSTSPVDHNNHQFDGFELDRRVIAAIDIDIGLFRELLVKGVIPKDGSAVPASKTGGFYVAPNAIRSFYKFYKIYKRWLRETPVKKPC